MPLHFKQLGHGEPLVLLHGLFGSGDNWFGVAPESPEKIRCLQMALGRFNFAP